MTQKTIDIIKDYKEYTDVYFLRTKQVLETKGINPLVRYQVFARQDIERLGGVDEAINFIKGVIGDKAKIYALQENTNYTSKEPVLKIEGHVQDLVDLETVYLGILSGRNTPALDMLDVKDKAEKIIAAAHGKPTSYFGARHFHYSYDEEIGKISHDAGFIGASTDIAAKSWYAKGLGTVPHAGILSMDAYMRLNNISGNPSVEYMKAFDEVIDKNVPRILLADTYNREISDAIATADSVPSLKGVRIDTCGENYAEGSQSIALPKLDVPEKYLSGKGVTIQSIWAIRRGLSEAGKNNLELVISSGFNAEKTAAFVEADRVYTAMYGEPLFNSIGTGSVSKPVMFTSDIVAFYDENKSEWTPLNKNGRYETPSNRLVEV